MEEKERTWGESSELAKHTAKELNDHMLQCASLQRWAVGLLAVLLVSIVGGYATIKSDIAVLQQTSTMNERSINDLKADMRTWQTETATQQRTIQQAIDALSSSHNQQNNPTHR